MAFVSRIVVGIRRTGRLRRRRGLVADDGRWTVPNVDIGFNFAYIHKIGYRYFAPISRLDDQSTLWWRTYTAFENSGKPLDGAFFLNVPIATHAFPENVNISLWNCKYSYPQKQASNDWKG